MTDKKGVPPPRPKIDITKPEYDQSTYLGRMKNFYITTNPMLCLKSKSEIRAAQDYLEEFKKGDSMKKFTEAELWKAKYIVDGCIHSDTKEIVPFYARFAFFAPSNIILVCGMINAFSIPATVAWQVINQTYMAVLNDANGPKGEKKVPFQTKSLNFTAAIVSSVGTAVGMNLGIQRSKMTPEKKMVYLRYVPFFAVCAANVVNVGLTRRNDLVDGVLVKDDKGRVLGSSKKAGRKAVGSTLITRLAICVPAVFFPGLIINQLTKMGKMPKGIVGVTAMNAVVVGAILLATVPPCIAIFPQEVKVESKNLEDKFHNMKDKNGKNITQMYFNKGL